MSRPLLALPLAALLATTACSAIATDKALPAKKPAASSTTAAPTTAPPSPATAPALTPDQAQAALITDTDLGEPWTMTEGAATWRDGLLKATANAPACQRLLDTLYTEEFFGADAQVRARTGLDDTWNDAQLHHQVVADRPADVDRTLAWLKTMPKKCGRFKAATATGTVQNAEVTAAPLPKIGDARQSLRLTLNGESAAGEETTLTLDVAVVRIGDDTIVLTNGGPGDVYAEITQGVAELGAKRLTDVRKQARVEV
ncbi:hypothetical protein ACFWWC_06240 [Streptomyces sp. NPDC058642]|uniref:hypothetical protein n=1 Tax=Streptomyces sp. NPDC058642 TaxID=3346572 RepID=UPI00366A31D9